MKTVYKLKWQIKSDALYGSSEIISSAPTPVVVERECLYAEIKAAEEALNKVSHASTLLGLDGMLHTEITELKLEE